jgi:hypothetical protein
MPDRHYLGKEWRPICDYSADTIVEDFWGQVDYTQKTDDSEKCRFKG